MDSFNFSILTLWWKTLLMFWPVFLSVAQMFVPALRWKDLSLNQARLYAVLWTFGIATWLFYFGAQPNMAEHVFDQNRAWDACIAQKNFDACKAPK